VTYNFQTIG